MLSEELQKALDAAFVSARMEGHDLPTVEHPPLALLSDHQFSEVPTPAKTDVCDWRANPLTSEVWVSAISAVKFPATARPWV